MEISNQINGLWIKGRLSSLENLTILSFLEQKYEFTLWTYDNFELYSDIKGLIVKDARTIIPEDEVFCYSNTNQFGHGKGSFAGFSDIFRYKLLYLFGGWWVDMDVTCLKRFDFDTPYVFRKSKLDSDYIVGNIMHVPKGTTLMKKCYEEAKEAVHAESNDWMLPINILNQNIKEEQLTQYVYSFSNEDSWITVSSLLIYPKYPQSWHAIHWMNEEFRRIKISKEIYLQSSVLGNHYEKYNLGIPIKTKLGKLQYTFNASKVYYAMIHFRRETFFSSMYYLMYNLFYLFSDFYFLKIRPRFDLVYYLKRLVGIKRVR
ncbi:MAG: capsular polysaccharide synthesis protein [Chitinophagales bacterium]|nr:capsular polysaccharide synthesis protein [Chitinophagales bacterium]